MLVVVWKQEEKGDGLPLQEGLENTAGLLVDHGTDTLDTTTTGN